MTVEELARHLAVAFQEEGKREIRGIAALENAGPDELAYAEGERALSRAAVSLAGLILVPRGVTLPGRTTLAVSHPKLAFLQAAEILRPPEPQEEGVHPTAVVHAEAVLAAAVSVGPHAVIERRARVGAGTRIGAGVFLGEDAEVGSAG